MYNYRMPNVVLEKKGKRIHLERLVLNTLATCGVISVALIAPNVLGALKKIDPHWEHKLDPRRRVNQTISRLKQKGLIVFSKSGGQLHITQKGQRLLQSIDEGKFYVRKPLRWDGRWRMVMFDVAEHRRQARDTLRRMLRKVGFVQLQGSVWVYPYDCEGVIKLITADQHLGTQVLYAIVDVLEGDASLRSRFGLRAN